MISRTGEELVVDSARRMRRLTAEGWRTVPDARPTELLTVQVVRNEPDTPPVYETTVIRELPERTRDGKAKDGDKIQKPRKDDPGGPGDIPTPEEGGRPDHAGPPDERPGGDRPVR